MKKISSYGAVLSIRIGSSKFLGKNSIRKFEKILFFIAYSAKKNVIIYNKQILIFCNY